MTEKYSKIRTLGLATLLACSSVVAFAEENKSKSARCLNSSQEYFIANGNVLDGNDEVIGTTTSSDGYLVGLDIKEFKADKSKYKLFIIK